jgi:hypothetical protein
MLPRIALVLVTLFWLAMNVLLWRAEYGQRTGQLASLPAEVVWQKMLTAPDSSSLTVFHRGKKIGFCHWTTSIGQQLSKAGEDESQPEGMIPRIADYRVQFDGNLNLGEFTRNLRFDSSLQLSARDAWQEFKLRVNLFPAVIEIRSSALEQKVHIKADDGQNQFQRTFRFADLNDPRKILREVPGPVGGALWGSAGLGQLGGADSLDLGLKWQAHHDRLKIAHSLTRVYRLEAHVMERYSAVVFVSRVGEILRVELPDDLVLVNDQLAGY